MIRKVTLITFLLFYFGVVSFSQKIDTTEVLLNAKLHFLTFDNSLKSRFYINNFLRYTPKFKFIKSKGFDDSFVFFKIHAVPYRDTNTNYIDNGSVSNPVYFGNLNYEFIFGYSSLTNKLYTLKGFDSNDFDQLFDSVSNSPYYEKSHFKSLRSFLNSFRIEGLDLKCLYKSLRRKKNKHKYPCLQKAKPVYK